MKSPLVKWGILGPGAIAHEFAMGIKNSAHATLVGVGSRSIETAREFAMNYEAEKFYGSYEELVADPNIDVIYVATPHVFHKEQTLLCLNAGKHVLCEKPFALNASDAQEMVECAQKNGLFLMEAMWTRFFPLVIKLKEILEQKRIGTIVSLEGDFAFKGIFDPESRLFNKDLGGGALYDIGIYLLSFAHMIMGAPEKVEAGCDIGVTDVDESCNIILRYPEEAVARLFCSITEQGDDEFRIVGTHGNITIDRHFWKPKRMVVEVEGEGLKEYTFELEGNGYNYEVDAVSQAILDSKREHPAMPLGETVEILKTLDKVIEQAIF